MWEHRKLPKRLVIYGQCVYVFQNLEYSFIAEWVYLQPYLIGMCVFVHNVCVCPWFV